MGFLHCYKSHVEGSYKGTIPNDRIYLDASNHFNTPDNGSTSDLCMGYKTGFVWDPNDMYGDYSVSVDVLNANSDFGTNFGHVGFVYNSKDQSNFEFIYLRIHNESLERFQQGVVANDNFTYTSGLRYFGTIDGSIWHALKITIEGYLLHVYLDNGYIGSMPTAFAPLRKAGILMFNGYGNAAWLQNLALCYPTDDLRC